LGVIQRHHIATIATAHVAREDPRRCPNVQQYRTTGTTATGAIAGLMVGCPVAYISRASAYRPAGLHKDVACFYVHNAATVRTRGSLKFGTVLVCTATTTTHKEPLLWNRACQRIPAAASYLGIVFTLCRGVPTLSTAATIAAATGSGIVAIGTATTQQHRPAM
jgi:hypothetical protein